MRLLGVVVPLPGQMLNGGRPRDRECDGTDNGRLTVATRHGGVSRAGFWRYAVGRACLGQRGSWWMRGWRAVRTGRPAGLGWLGSRWLQSSCGRFSGMNGQRGVASLGRGLGRSQVVGGVFPAGTVEAITLELLLCLLWWPAAMGRERSRCGGGGGWWPCWLDLRGGEWARSHPKMPSCKMQKLHHPVSMCPIRPIVLIGARKIRWVGRDMFHIT